MARQPLKSRLPKTGISLGPGFLRERPKAAALIAECIATWSEIELQMGRLIATLLGTPYEPVTVFFLNLANQRDKRKTLDPIANFIFAEDNHRELYAAVMRARSSSENERVELAHSLFGIASDDADGVIMIRTTDRIKHMIELDELLKNMHGRSSQQNFLDLGKNRNEKYQEIRNYIYHYSISDLEKIIDNMNQLHAIIPKFCGFAISVAQKRPDDEAYQRLMNEPLVRRFLCQKPTNRGDE